MKRGRTGKAPKRRVYREKVVKKYPKSSAKKDYDSELMYHDVSVGTHSAMLQIGTGSIWPATNNSLVLVPRGPGPEQYQGRKLMVRAVHVRYSIWQNGSAGVTAATFPNNGSNKVYVRLMCDTQPDGNNPSISDILNGYSGTDDVDKFNNLLEGGRFRCLAEQMHVLNQIHSIESAGPPAVYVITSDLAAGEIHKKRNISVTYAGTAGTIADVRENNLFLLVTQAYNLTNNNCYFCADIRVRYTDK
jgi:hypothetical protein